MLRYPLLHPPLIGALASAGHGSRVVIADANYAHATNVYPGAERIYLNLRPGLIAVDEILTTLLTAVPVESATAMRPDDGSTPGFWTRYQDILGPGVPLATVDRSTFYQVCREPDVAICVASGDDRHYANLLLTIGAVAPSTGA
ncbi:RbsD or FucU transport [Solihabitans fulvus]|uniref:RbsD or FucU transport n=1 Tax=Solihabitans fulvus TaxID=1892852 RepID=A0A5B2WLF2_9PSEU|nr:RbsD/FucU family protein [Solihabitans fulvus]KAA2252235.1 RbsD or FucU transport [Solihabitans fulvus]